MEVKRLRALAKTRAASTAPTSARARGSAAKRQALSSFHRVLGEALGGDVQLEGGAVMAAAKVAGRRVVEGYATSAQA